MCMQTEGQTWCLLLSVDLDVLIERVTILADLSIEELKNHLQF